MVRIALNIAEKPSVARELANIVGNKRAKRVCACVWKKVAFCCFLLLFSFEMHYFIFGLNRSEGIQLRFLIWTII